MSDQSASPYYEDHQPIYRAARARRWIESGVVKEIAFYRRVNGDSKGISVATTPETAKSGLRQTYGVIHLVVADVRSLDLNVVPDPDIAEKGNIVDPPCFDGPDPQLNAIGIRFARQLAGIANIHEE